MDDAPVPYASSMEKVRPVPACTHIAAWTHTGPPIHGLSYLTPNPNPHVSQIFQAVVKRSTDLVDAVFDLIQGRV